VDDLIASCGVFAATLIVGVVSGLVPVVNSEIYLVGAVVVTRDLGTALALAALLSVGQITAKAVLYQTARRATNASRRGKLAAKIDRARAVAAKWKSKPLTVIAISSVTGLPPFYVVSLVAGMIEVRFRTFIALGLAGRLVRFTTIAVIVVAV
jgi:membrane protein YqaA with SNARE-associated domain